MSEVFGAGASRKEALKSLIRKLHEGTSPEAAKAEFAGVTTDVTPAELAQIEQELILEGMPREEMMRLCDVHLAVFQDSLEEDGNLAPPGHPVHILMEEHKALLGLSSELAGIADEIAQAGDSQAASAPLERLDRIIDNIRNSESHYVREENVIFPYLEKHGITQPPAIMWMEHDQIREIKKSLYALVEERGEIDPGAFAAQLKAAGVSLAEMLASHFQKENSILFPASLEVFEENEWRIARQEFDELGYCPFTPDAARVAIFDDEETASVVAGEGEVAFETGSMPLPVLQSILNGLPVDLTFVDKDNIVRYFSDSPERIFPRTKAIIGRSVQNCHPQKSVHAVERILEDFKTGKREKAEFWINLQGTMILIRYFPVRSKTGEYLGCLEVSQDITDIQKLEGEKRLLDG
jgi:PAS domain S-box-containing protein